MNIFTVNKFRTAPYIAFDIAGLSEEGAEKKAQVIKVIDGVIQALDKITYDRVFKHLVSECLKNEASRSRSSSSDGFWDSDADNRVEVVSPETQLTAELNNYTGQANYGLELVKARLENWQLEKAPASEGKNNDVKTSTKEVLTEHLQQRRASMFKNENGADIKHTITVIIEEVKSRPLSEEKIIAQQKLK